MSNELLEQKIDEIKQRLETEATRIGAWDHNQIYHTACSKLETIPGLWLEFGVYRGRSLSTFADNTTNLVYGFDSFEGIPEHWNDENPKSVYTLNGQVPEGAIIGEEWHGMLDGSPTKSTRPWPTNVRLVKGWFSSTLPEFLKHHSEPVSFLHIDSDVYSSCKTVLTELKDRIINGTVILFDEILDYPEYRQHEIKAFAEFLLEKSDYTYEPIYHQKLGQYTQGCFRIHKIRK